LLVSFFYFHSFYFFLFFFFGLCHLHDHILCKWPRDLRGIYVGIYNIRIRWPAALSGVGNKFLIRIALITTILSADTAESPRAAHSQIQRYMALPYWKNKKRKKREIRERFRCDTLYMVPRAKASRQAYKSYTIRRSNTHSADPSRQKYHSYIIQCLPMDVVWELYYPLYRGSDIQSVYDKA